MNLQAAPLTSARLDQFAAKGLIELGSVLDAGACATLLDRIRATRTFSADLFQSEADFLANPQHVGVNPCPGRNLLETFNEDLDFIESNPPIVDALNEVIGRDYHVLNKKLVCGVPERHLPDWLVRRIKGNAVNNLGAYVKPQYRDITYFYGIDYHQDIIDYKNKPADFVTLYLYLHPVTREDAPLYVLPESHKLGATVFPHDLSKLSTDPVTWRYANSLGHSIVCQQKMLVGETGYAAFWHPCTLHGTQPDVADNERISVRYLLQKRDGGERAGIDLVNGTLLGPIELGTTRVDLAKDGAAQIKHNTINNAGA
jgi:Phytanoyl-CoA dioxygenase (PhyH)